ncbi:MAG TPA: YdeI/OmpD-associated family protein [Pyrinomonadaceae bacterium]|nr:YdeI/OmpD-associated family protein [Pyrinomonadaceae bacterium]
MPATSTKRPATSPAKAQAKGTEKPQRFRVQLETQAGTELAAFGVPFDVQKVFGTRARVPVRGTINGTPFRSSLSPMGGRHIMPVNRKLREAAGVRGGETVTVTMERDTEPRVVTPPEDFARALRSNKDARANWEKLSYTHQREYAEHVEDAKRPETRQRRIEKSIALLAAGGEGPR